MRGRSQVWARRWRAAATVAVAGLVVLTAMNGAAGRETGSIDAVKPGAGVLASSPMKVLADLDAVDYQVRQRMTRELLADGKLTPGMLKWLIDRAVTLEQLNRLLLVARHRVLREVAKDTFGQVGPGSLGLSHQSVSARTYPRLKEHGAVRVLLTIPGFPAYAHLEPGDVIVSLDGRLLKRHASATGFKKMIEAHQCGDLVTMRIWRGKEEKTLKFRLASAAALKAMYVMRNGKLKLHRSFRSHWLGVRRALLGRAPLGATALVPVKRRNQEAVATP